MQYDLGKRAIETGADYVNAQLERVNYGKLYKYFNIDNQYIVRKLYLIIFPFQSVSQDLYKPDLYIPTMSLATFLLFRAFLDGLCGTFTPERLCLSATRHLCFHCIFVGGYKAASYIVGTEFSVLDILALVGYKYTTAVVSTCLGFLPFAIFFKLFPAICFFFFLSRSLKSLLLTANPHRRILYFLFGVAACEMFLVIFITR